MFKFLIIVFIIVFSLYCYQNKLHINFKTFLKKGFKVDKSLFGLYCLHSKQGTGKTMNSMIYLLELKDKTHYPIYANLKSIKGLEYFYYSGLNTFLEICTTKTHCIIFFDEIFKFLGKDSKLSQQQKDKLKDALCQMRKRRIICVSTCQEWLDLPIELRRYVKTDIECTLIAPFNYPILFKKFYNTTLIKWDPLYNEYVSPVLGTYIEHGRKKIANMYDTLEVITSQEIAPILTYNEPVNLPGFVALSRDSQVKSVNEKSIASATSISNRQVISQFTNKHQTTLTTSNKDIDIDFWGQTTKKELEENEQNVRQVSDFDI